MAPASESQKPQPPQQPGEAGGHSRSLILSKRNQPTSKSGYYGAKQFSNTSHHMSVRSPKPPTSASTPDSNTEQLTPSTENNYNNSGKPYRPPRSSNSTAITPQQDSHSLTMSSTVHSYPRRFIGSKQYAGGNTLLSPQPPTLEPLKDG